MSAIGSSAKRLKVCIFSQAMAAHRNGKFLWPFSLIARQLAEQGHEVTVITTAHPDRRTRLAIEHGAEVHYLGATRPEKTDQAYWRESGKRFDELHRNRHFDVVIGRGRSSYGYLAYSRYAGTLPLVSHEGTFPAWLHGYELSRRLFSRPRERVHALAYAAANRVHASCLGNSSLIVCNSPALASLIGKTFWWREVPAAYVPYGMSPVAFQDEGKGVDPGSKVSELLQSGRRFVVYVGRVTRNKGIFDLLEAVHRLRHNDVKLLIAGAANGANSRRVKRLTREYGLEDRIVMAGAVPHAALPAILNRAEVMLFPSVHPESLPKVVMEAMACALPVVAYRLPAFQGLVDHGVEGLLAKPKDVKEIAAYLDCLLGDDATRRKMGEAARKRIEDCFKPEMVSALWSDVLGEVVRGVRNRQVTDPSSGSAPGDLSCESGAS